jgi:hypothetical protein
MGMIPSVIGYRSGIGSRGVAGIDPQRLERLERFERLEPYSSFKSFQPFQWFKTLPENS